MRKTSINKIHGAFAVYLTGLLIASSALPAQAESVSMEHSSTEECSMEEEDSAAESSGDAAAAEESCEEMVSAEEVFNSDIWTEEASSDTVCTEETSGDELSTEETSGNELSTAENVSAEPPSEEAPAQEYPAEIYTEADTSVYEQTAWFGTGYIHGSAPVYRKAAFQSDVLTTLTDGFRVYVMGRTEDPSASAWYKIRFEYNDYSYVGYVQAELVSCRTDAVSSISDFSVFPASYQAPLAALQAAHPNWVFEPFYTGLDWQQAVNGELGSSLANCLVTASSKSGYWSMEQLGTDSAGLSYHYDWSTNTWYNWQPGWYAASEEGLKYCMDPRNFLNEQGIFMFEKMTYGNQTASMVEQVLTGTFMSNTIITDDTTEGEPIAMTYAELFTWIGNEYNINPVMLASRVRQEQGTAGTSDLISGAYPGYEGLYNYFNINASGHTRDEIITNGLIEAQTGSTMELPNGISYTGPWNSRVKAVIGGSLKVASRYIDQNQDTLYLQKFDVDGTYNGLYWHQYMQNIQAPISEGKSAYRAYQSYGALDGTFVFKIPVYNNMNDSNPEPDVRKNPNNYLKSIQVNGTELIRTFDRNITSYAITVTSSTGTAVISAQTAAASSSVSGTGSFPLAEGENLFVLSVTAEDGTVRNYRLTVNLEKCPDPVTTLNATVINGSYVSLFWNPVTGAEGYAVYRQTAGESSTVYLGCAADNHMYDTKLSFNIEYTYRVYPYYKQEGRVILSPSIVTASATVLYGPENLTAAGTSAGVRLTWSPLDGAGGYLIYRKAENSAGFTYLDKVSGTEFTDTAASLFDYSFYRVYPCYTADSGVTITGKSSSYVYGRRRLPSVSGLTASSQKSGVQIRWNTVSEAEGYLIYGIRAGSPYGYIGMTTSASSTTFSDKIASDTGYNFYWVFPYIRQKDGTLICGPISSGYVYGKKLN